MKLKFINIIFIFLFFTSCVGTSSQGIFGTGVSIAFDPRSIGTQIDDSIMQKNLSTRLALKEKFYILSISNKVLDGRIFLTGKVDNPEEKLQITKSAWETAGVRSVRNDIKIKEKFNFKRSAKDLLITSQLRTALIFNKKIKAEYIQLFHILFQDFLELQKRLYPLFLVRKMKQRLAGFCIYFFVIKFDNLYRR